MSNVIRGTWQQHWNGMLTFDHDNFLTYKKHDTIFGQVFGQIFG